MTPACEEGELENDNAKKLCELLERHMDRARDCYGGSASPDFIAAWLDHHGVTAP